MVDICFVSVCLFFSTQPNCNICKKVNLFLIWRNGQLYFLLVVQNVNPLKICSIGSCSVFLVLTALLHQVTQQHNNHLKQKLFWRRKFSKTRVCFFTRTNHIVIQTLMKYPHRYPTSQLSVELSRFRYKHFPSKPINTKLFTQFEEDAVQQISDFINVQK